MKLFVTQQVLSFVRLHLFSSLCVRYIHHVVENVENTALELAFAKRYFGGKKKNINWWFCVDSQNQVLIFLIVPHNKASLQPALHTLIQNLKKERKKVFFFNMISRASDKLLFNKIMYFG